MSCPYYVEWYKFSGHKGERGGDDFADRDFLFVLPRLGSKERI